MTADPAAPSTDPELAHLTTAVDVTARAIVGVRPDQAHEPTPCPRLDVAQLLDHLVGWATGFADRANGVTEPTDPGSVVAGDDPETSYRKAADRMLAGYRSGVGGERAPAVGVVLIETITHGWDLATATGQRVDYPTAAVEAALAAGRRMLSPEYRGPDMPFGDEVSVAESAPALDRLVGFMGRDPGWSAGPWRA
jgi:uncharacterized protein (TIGR03086 family)